MCKRHLYCHSCYATRYRVPLCTGKWAGYIDREIKLSLFHFVKAVECLPNRLTPFNSEIHYKEENYLKVRTVVFKYITPPIVKGSVYWYISILYSYVFTFLYSHILSSTMWLSYPLSYGSTGFISPAFYILILTLYKSPLSTYTILLIRSVTPAPFSLSLFLKSSFISKLLIRGILYPVLTC